jgi:hypothetical protein
MNRGRHNAAGAFDGILDGFSKIVDMALNMASSVVS